MCSLPILPSSRKPTAQAGRRALVNLPDIYGRLLSSGDAAPIHPEYATIRRDSNRLVMETLRRNWGSYAPSMSGEFPLYATYNLPSGPAELVRTCAD
jgi:hypothetical protein